MLEQQIGQLITSIDNLTAALKSAGMALAPVAATKEKKKPADAVPVEQDPFAFTVSATTEAVTEEKVRDVLKVMMAKCGKAKVVALCVKHGAKADKPLITDIPVANYKAVVEDAEKEIKTVKA